MNIALQRCAAANADRALLFGNPSHNFFDLTEPCGARFSPAMDVLPFYGLLLSPDQVRLSNVSK
jgi:hypothetical protein